MVEEWTGAWVHNSEFEVKQPQLEPHPVGQILRLYSMQDLQEQNFQFKIFYPTILLQPQLLVKVLAFLFLLMILMKAQLILDFKQLNIQWVELQLQL